MQSQGVSDTSIFETPQTPTRISKHSFAGEAADYSPQALGGSLGLIYSPSPLRNFGLFGRSPSSTPEKPRRSCSKSLFRSESDHGATLGNHLKGTTHTSEPIPTVLDSSQISQTAQAVTISGSYPENQIRMTTPETERGRAIHPNHTGPMSPDRVQTILRPLENIRDTSQKSRQKQGITLPPISDLQGTFWHTESPDEDDWIGHDLDETSNFNCNEQEKWSSSQQVVLSQREIGNWSFPSSQDSTASRLSFLDNGPCSSSRCVESTNVPSVIQNTTQHRNDPVLSSSSSAIQTGQYQKSIQQVNKKQGSNMTSDSPQLHRQQNIMYQCAPSQLPQMSQITENGVYQGCPSQYLSSQDWLQANQTQTHSSTYQHDPPQYSMQSAQSSMYQPDPQQYLTQSAHISMYQPCQPQDSIQIAQSSMYQPGAPQYSMQSAQSSMYQPVQPQESSLLSQTGKIIVNGCMQETLEAEDGQSSEMDISNGKRFRRKRVTGDVPGTLQTKRKYSQNERRRRTKTCCIYYADLDDVNKVIRKLTEASEQYVHVFVRITHFFHRDGGIWVVFVVKEAIPESSWNRLRLITNGDDVCLNPPIDTNQKTFSSFLGVTMNFPYITVELLDKNELPMSHLPKAQNRQKDQPASPGKRSRNEGIVAADERAEADEGSSTGNEHIESKRAKAAMPIPEALSLCETFLHRGRLITPPDFDQLISSVKTYLQSLPNNQGSYSLALLDGLQVEYFAQAMMLQSCVATGLVDRFGFSRTFTRLSLSHLESPEQCMANLPSDEARTQLSALMDSQEKVFALNLVLLDNTSLMFLISTQLIQLCYGFAKTIYPKDPVSIESAKILAHDLQGLSDYIKRLAEFSTAVGFGDYIDQRLLQAPELPKILADLVRPTVTLRASYVNSHRIRISAVISKLATGAPEHKAKILQLQKIFNDMQDTSPYLKHATFNSQGFSMLSANSFSQHQSTHKESVPGFLEFLDAFKNDGR